MKRLALCLAALVLALGISGVAQAKTYINGIDANYPPFAFVDKEGKPSGFDVESLDWIAKKMGFEVKHQPMDWDGVIPAVLAKKIDMVCSGMSVSPERVAQVNFSDPYFTVSKVMVGKADSTLTLNEIMKGKLRLGVQRGTNEHELLEQMKETEKLNYDLRFYDSAPMAIEDLLNGRIDAIGMDSAPANDAISKGKAIKVLGKFADDDVFGVAVHKDNAELLNILNEGYKALKADPFWQELQAKYLQ